MADEQLTPDFKTIADLRKNNGAVIRRVCREFIVLCRRLGLFSHAIVAIDGSKFKAVNNCNRNFMAAKGSASLSRSKKTSTGTLDSLMPTTEMSLLLPRPRQRT